MQALRRLTKNQAKFQKLGGDYLKCLKTPVTFTASKTAYTAVPGDQIGVDTVANIVTITLPAGVVGDEVIIMDISASNGFGTNKCIVAPNGSDKIQGTAASQDLTTNNQSVTLFYTGSDKGWQFKTNTA